MKQNIVFLLMLACFAHVVKAQQKPQLVVEKGNNAAINSVHYSPDARYIISTCLEEGTAKIWETTSGRIIATLAADATDAWYSESGKYIVIDGSDKYDVYDNNQVFLYTITKPEEKQGFFSFANEDKWIVTAANDSVVNICNADNGRIIQNITTHHSRIMLAKLSAGDKRLITLSADSVARIIDIQSDSVLYEQKRPGLLPKTIELSRMGGYAAIAWYARKKPWLTEDSLVSTTVWETATAKQILTGYSVAAFSSTISIVLRKNARDTVQTIINLPDGDLFTIPARDSEEVMYSRDDKQLYRYTSDSLQTFDMGTGKMTDNIHIPERYVSKMLSEKKILEVVMMHPKYNENNFETNSGFYLQPRFLPATAPSISPDGKKIALGFADGTVAELSTSSASYNGLITDSGFLSDKRFTPALPGVELPRVLHNDGITLFTDAFNSVIDAAYVSHQPYPYIFTKTWDNQGIIWNNQDITIRYQNDLNYFGNIYTDLNRYFFGAPFNFGIRQTPSIFTPDGRFFLLVNPTGKTLWKTDSLVKIFPKAKEGMMSNDADILFHEFAASPNGSLTCDIGRHEEADPEMLMHIYRMNINNSAKKEIHTLPWKMFFRYKDDYDISGMATEVAFAGDARHLVLWFYGQGTRLPFDTKLITLKDGISILGINPRIPDDGDMGSGHHDGFHASYSTQLRAYIVCTHTKIYWISAANGQVIKTMPVQLKEPQLSETLDFDPAVKLAFYKDSADEKIYAVDVKTGKALYALQNKENAFSIASFSPDQSRFVTLTEDGTGATVWDAITGNSVLSFTGHTTKLLNATYSSDGKFILCCAQDGSYEKRDAYTGKLIYIFFLFRDYDFAIVLPEGYYYSSSRSDVRYLNFRLNNRLYNFSQFDLQFNRPDKILEALGSTDTALINAWHKAWIKRIANSGFAEADFDSGTIHVPEVTLLNRGRLVQVNSDKNFFFYFNLSDNLYKVKSYNIYVNDVPVYGVNGIKLPNAVNNTLLGEHVLLDSGINKIEVGCTNEKDADSRRESFYITCNPEKKEPSKTWFIGIGINRYSQHHYLPDLLYCVNDIRDLAAAFKAKNSNIEIDTLINEEASRDNILLLKSRLMQSGENDRVIVSFNGHGIGYHGEFYFATPFLNPQSPEAGGISYADMKNLLDSIPARKKLLLIDACHSGESDVDDISGGIVANGLTYTIDSVKTDASRGNSSVEIIDVKADDNRQQFNVYDMMKSAFIDLRKNNGAVVIAASQSRQQALEKRDYGNGLFTHCVLNQFSIPSLNVSQLLLRINEQMKQETKQQQSVSRQELSESDWALW